MKIRNLLQRFIMPSFANMTFFAAIFFCMILVVSMAFGADIPVTIDIGTSTSAANYAVSSGIPFPIGTVTDITALRMLDSNSNAVPCQFTTLVNWPDGSIKVAKATFYPTVSGNGYAGYTVRNDTTGTITNPSVTNPVTVSTSSNGTQTIVNTGAATFYIDNNTFTVFDQVNINGVNQMASPGDIIFVDNITGNTFKTSLATNYTLTQTETGPIRTTFLATGRAQAVSGTNQFSENTLVTVKLWITFYANSGRVDLKYTWVDDVARTNAINHWGIDTGQWRTPPTTSGTAHLVEISNNYINLPLTPVSNSMYAFGGNGSTYTGVVSGTNFLLQDAMVSNSAMPANPDGNGYDYVFTYSGVGSQTATGGLNGGSQLPADLTGGRAPGWMDITRGSVGVTAGIKDFWQNFPNKLSITDQGNLQISVQPPESSNVMYTLATGVAKTHDIYLDFHADANTVAASQRFLLFQERPLIYANAAWYAQTKVFGSISAPDANSAVWDTQMDVMSNCAFDRIGCSYYIRPYGKRNYGDYIGGNNTGATYTFYDSHYEDAHGWILQYLRLGRKRYFNFSESFAKHHYDLDVMHVGWPGYPDNGNVPGMVHWHGGGEHEISALETGHVVPGGIDEYYLLTGDPRALEVSKEQGDWVANRAANGGMRVVPEFAGDPVRGYEYERAQAWMLYTVLKTYESTSDIKYFNAATIAIKNSIDWWKFPQPIVQFACGSDSIGAYPPATVANGSNVVVIAGANWRWYFNTNYTITGAGIPAGTVVSSITNDINANTTTITMSQAATADGANVILTIDPNITTTATVTNPPSAATLQSIQSQALYYETLDWTKGNGYFLSTFQTDNTAQTNIPESSDPASWVYQNHVPIAWMAAYFDSAIIRYLEDYKSTVGAGPYSVALPYRTAESASVSAQGASPTFTIDQPTIKEMLVQTANLLATHNFMGGGNYASVIPWMSNINNDVYPYSIAPERVLYNNTSGDGGAEMPWVLLYVSTFQPSDLLQPSLWTAKWPSMVSKFQAIAKLSFDYTQSSFNLSSDTGYDGAPVLWNMPYAMSLAASSSVINGSCGAAGNSNFSSIPTINLCINGAASGVTGAGPWSWNCVGYNGGTTANCSATYSSAGSSGSGNTNNGGPTTTSGVCGSDNGSAVSSAPTNLCSVGTASTLSGTGPWTWTCTGTDNAPIACSANIALAPDPNALTFSCTVADTNPLPSPWVTIAGQTPIEIASNNCIATDNTNGSRMYTKNILSLDQYSQATFNTITSGSGIILRASPTVNTQYQILFDGTSADIYRVVSGTSTYLGNVSAFCWNSGDTLRGSITGSTLTVYKNGVLVGSITDPSPINVAGYPGVSLYNGGTITSWSGNVIANGVCGSANNQSLISAPASNLCSVGTASSLSGTGPWGWSCSGSGGGSTTSCSALLQTSANSGLPSDPNAFTFSCTGTNISPIPAPWVTVPTDNPIEIVFNNCVQTSTNGRMYNSQVFSMDQYSQATFSNLISGSGVILRSSPSTYTQYQVLFDGTSADFYKITFGVSAYLGSVSAFSWNNGDTLRGQIIGSTLYAYKNGALIGSIVDPDPITTPGYPGVSLYNGGSVSSWSGNAIANGVCGSVNGADLTTAPSTNLCTSGTASSISGAGPWSWSCAGSGGGSSATCSALLQTSGTCGSANNQSFIAAPTTGFCSSGTATAVTGAGPWNWTCVGANGGATASCSALLPVNGVCGSANRADFTTAPSANLCATGAASSLTGTGSWSWTCVGANGGVAASCSALLSVNGVCGTANNQPFASAPTTGFCSSGTATTVTGTGPWDWTCVGANGGSTATCSANAPTTFTLNCNSANINPIPSPWSIVTGSYALQIKSDSCETTNTSGSRMYNNKILSLDQYSQITFKSIANNNGIILRSSSSNYTQYQIEINATNVEFYRIVSGTSYLLGKVSSGAWAAGNTLKGSITGSTLSAYKNGTLLGSITDTTPISTPGYPGISLYESGTISSWSGSMLQ